MTMQAVYNKTNNNTMGNKDKINNLTDEKYIKDDKFINK